MFVYGKYFQDGSCILLSDHEEWMQYHLAKGYPVPAPIPVHLLEKREAFHLIPDTGRFQKAKYDLIQKYDSDQAIDFIRRGKDYYEVVCFSFPRGYQDVMNTIVNNLNTFREFYAIFKEKAAKLLKPAENQKIILPTHMTGIDFKALSVADNQVLSDTPGSQMKKMFNQNFSTRQIEVLLHTIRGKTASQIAFELGLSKRTVEYYLENIKNRMGVYSKSELVNKAIPCLKDFI